MSKTDDSFLFDIDEKNKEALSKMTQPLDEYISFVKNYCKERGQWFNFRQIRKITTGRQFGYPNGYWRVPKEASSSDTTKEMQG